MKKPNSAAEGFDYTEATPTTGSPQSIPPPRRYKLFPDTSEPLFEKRMGCIGFARGFVIKIKAKGSRDDARIALNHFNGFVR